MSEEEKSLDLIGLGKLAKEIPDEVFTKASDTTWNAFEKLISPITETTSGLGRYIKQIFDNMVEVEQSLLSYSMENARKKMEAKGISECRVSHPKTIVRIMEEVSKETDSLLNELWTNLICTELETGKAHPFYVNILSSISQDEARLLQSLNSFSDIGGYKSNVLMPSRAIRRYSSRSGGEEYCWNLSCSLLLDLGLAEPVVPDTHENGGSTVILYLTKVGQEFIKSVSN